jgi:hypothetical protein
MAVHDRNGIERTVVICSNGEQGARRVKPRLVSREGEERSSLQLWAQSVNRYYFLDVLTISGAHIEVQSKVFIASIATRSRWLNHI